MSVASTQPGPFPRLHAVAILLLIACAFASNHIAARFAFDDNTGLLLAIVSRSGLCLLALASIVIWQRPSLRLPAGSAPWQLTLGILVAIQSFCMFSAVARIPVAIALLISNTFPILLALLTWALGGKPPTRKMCILMGIILIGLLLVLDIPAQLTGSADRGPEWTTGVLFALAAATVFAVALWITEHRLGRLVGTVRSLYTVSIIFCSMLVIGISGLVPGGMNLPDSSVGWIGLFSVAILYTAGFSTMFVLIPRLDMARNSPVMNIEPVLSLLLGWMLLEQVLGPIQLVGGAVVLSCIVALAYQRKG